MCSVTLQDQNTMDRYSNSRRELLFVAFVDFGSFRVKIDCLESESEGSRSKFQVFTQHPLIYWRKSKCNSANEKLAKVDNKLASK